jgi:hypothetical protein
METNRTEQTESDVKGSAFKQQWEARKLLKRAKKQSKKQLMKRGHSAGEATGMINQALKNISRGA